MRHEPVPPAREPVPIETELDCQRVQERIDQLLGCLEDSEEEAELIALTEAFEIWERKRWLQ
jgi:hypothetical protein